MRRICILVMVLLLAGSDVGRRARAQDHGHPTPHAAAPATTQPALATPPAIRAEHEHLHHQLDAALAAGGKTSERARAVADVLVPHFEEEEAYAMPPLGLLPALARGEELSDEHVREAIAMSERLRANYDQMLREHAELAEALKALAAAARDENKLEHARFAETLLMHAGNEEQVLYPTTLLIGDYLKLRRHAQQAGGHAPSRAR